MQTDNAIAPTPDASLSEVASHPSFSISTHWNAFRHEDGEAMIEEILESAQEHFDKALSSFKRECDKIRTGRASLGRNIRPKKNGACSAAIYGSRDYRRIAGTSIGLSGMPTTRALSVDRCQRQSCSIRRSSIPERLDYATGSRTLTACFSGL